MNTPPLLDGYKANFETLKKACKDNNLALVSCIDKKTGEPRAVLCATSFHMGQVSLIPLAMLFDGDPYEELEPPV